MAPPTVRRRPAPLVSDLRGLPDRHAFIVTAAQNTFQRLRVGAVLLDATNDWHAIYTQRSVTVFELAHGRGPERYTYNSRAVARARQEQKLVRGEHAGFTDFFVPVVHDGVVEALLITGPIAKSRPTVAEIRERWRWLTGRHGHPSDPELGDYVAATQSTLTLEGEQLLRYEHWLTLLAVLLAEQRGAKLLGREAAMLSASLEEARFVERMWESTKEMVDEATTGVWMSPQLGDDLLRLGSERLPEHVVIGLVARSPASDPVDVLLRTDAFRRACVDLALASRAVCGLVGSQGVVFLQSSAGLGSRARGDQTRLAEDARSLARVHGLSLHVGISSDDRGHLLPARYEQALGAAERALSEGLTVARAESRFAPLPASNALRSLRHDLGSLHSGRAEALVAKLDHYVEAVAVHTGGRLELSRPHLEVGFESAERALLGTGAVPEPIAQETNQMLERSVRDAASLAELSAAYRRAVVELAEVVDHPGTANQARSLRRALSFIREHLSEPLGLTHVSRVAGFSPNYFSQLFKRSEGTTFELHVRKVRIEHAKELLASTDLEIRRVVQLAGFSSREHFHRAFKAVVGTTPVAYRRSRPVSRHRAPAVRKTRGRAPK